MSESRTWSPCTEWFKKIRAIDLADAVEVAEGTLFAPGASRVLRSAPSTTSSFVRSAVHVSPVT
jgi:hypothetical protein